MKQARKKKRILKEKLFYFFNCISTYKIDPILIIDADFAQLEALKLKILHCFKSINGFRPLL